MLSRWIQDAISQWRKAEQVYGNGSLADFLAMTHEEYEEWLKTEKIPRSLRELYKHYNVPSELPVIPPIILRDLHFYRDIQPHSYSARYLISNITDIGPRCSLKQIRLWIQEDHKRIASIVWHLDELKRNDNLNK